MWRGFRVASAALAAFVLGLAGCGGDPLQRQAVSGTVTFKGKPLATGSIEFFPADPGVGTGSGAPIGDGLFQIAKDKGLSPGNYKVRVNAPDHVSQAPGGAPGSDSAGTPPKELIPAKYNANTTLTAEVKKGAENVFTFNLD